MSSEEIRKRRIVEVLSQHSEPVPHKQLRETLGMPAEEFSKALKQLMEENTAAVTRSSSGLLISLSSKGLSKNFEMVLEEVRRSGASGVDQSTLTAKLRLPKTEISKALNSLVAQKYIKEHRSFTNRAKKMYLLFNLEPSAQVTGGSFYRGEELDVNLVDSLRCLLLAFVYQKKCASMREIQQFVEGISSATESNSVVSTKKELLEEEGSADEELSTVSVSSSPTAADLRHYYSSPISVVSASTPTVMPERASGGEASRHLLQRRRLQVMASAASSLMSRKLSRADVAVLTNSLVLDGVLEELSGDVGTGFLKDEQSGRLQHRFQLAVGKNVMRHFSVMPVVRGAEDFTGDLEDIGSHGIPRRLPSGAAWRRKRGRGGATPSTTRQAEDVMYVPSTLSRPTAAGGSTELYADWAYMPAMGFPCLGCPQLRSCRRGGIINSAECAYLTEWLEE